ncbi:MAG: Transcriptional activator spt7 [Trizodia sp. TS-e1964]|nr:MAG: Transcriptional activator spt7 [Trizodia sp. TS-e1964]
MAEGVNGTRANININFNINIDGDGDSLPGEDPRVAIFKDLYAQSEARIADLFDESKGRHLDDSQCIAEKTQEEATNEPIAATNGTIKVNQTPKKPVRAIDENDYDDSDSDDDDDDDDGTNNGNISPLKFRSTGLYSIPILSGHSPVEPPALISKLSDTSSTDPVAKAEEIRKKLAEDKKAAEDAAKRSFHTLFYTLENDRDAMLEQRKLEESERQVDAEMSGAVANGYGNTSAGQSQQGKLSNANLGASSLTLKHLIARIDAKRDQVRASDSELRTLMSEVRKNRSKWANEERVGQEDLYEAAEKVLSELKALTEYSAPFLSRVNRREAPDYYSIIKHPMDLGAMTKKLKTIAYKSKKEFVDDLNLIWNNCLKYNGDKNHPLRKNAASMKKETDKLIPLIPDIVIRDRAEVEAEERRLQNGDCDAEGGEESDDEPIMSSRGRKAPGKKGASKARKAPTTGVNATPISEPNPVPNSSSSNPGLKLEFTRADSDAPMDLNGFSTPPLGPPGTITPAGINGICGSNISGSQADAMEIDGYPSVVGLGQGLGSGDSELEDLEYKTWKQVTKRDRALAAAERNRLFRGDKLNPEEPALLRTRVGMRRWLRNQRQAEAQHLTNDAKAISNAKGNEESSHSLETLAEGMEGEDERVLPDYYDPVSSIPILSERLQWIEDAEGQIVDTSEEFLRLVPKGHFVSPESSLTKRLEANVRQMQDTRRVCSKIGVIKQMQLQSQMYQNQFQKYNPEPFVEQDIIPHVMSDDGPVMAHWTCRAALQRSVAKIFFHAGFEEFQPSALDAITDIAADFFTQISQTFVIYREGGMIPVESAPGVPADGEPKFKERFTQEELILHCLHENGQGVESLESYVKDDVERVGAKLGVVHERMKAHLADLLRPALADNGDGSTSFNDGSEQFVGGDFAEDLNEDFFGFRELGLDKEFGLASLSVPLHLLQNRMYNAHHAQNSSIITTSSNAFETLPPLEPLTIQSLKSQIGLVQNFFLAKLHANSDQPLVEDEDLPQRQRLPKPRLPPTGKISSPRKRPIKEQGGNSKKKKKTDPEHGIKAIGKLKLVPPSLERTESAEGSAVGMISPESIPA